MDSHSLTRKDFITLTLTLIGGGAVVAGCSSSSSANDGGTGGSTGAGGADGGTGGSTGVGGSGGGVGGHVGSDAAADGAGDLRSDTANNCADPLPARQITDATAHTHTMDVPVSTLSATTTQMLFSGPFPDSGSGGHIHQINLTPTDLTTLRGGGSVTVMSSMDGTPIHSHMFMVSCHGD